MRLFGYQPEMGLSPPTRGNLRPALRPRPRVRSIPAHAGEPGSARCWRCPMRVYPRPRGGTLRYNAILYSYKGLSPPTRGNPTKTSANRVTAGSIPAHAGEPPHIKHRRAKASVYPRPRGGTAAAVRQLLRQDGLSPPTRGNRSLSLRRLSRGRSIPAHAGEPTPCRGYGRARAVYPRPRGGTTTSPTAPC